MRSSLIVIAMAVALGGCAIATQIATQQDIKKANECMADVKASPEWQLVHKRIWAFDGTDTADKLTDPKPLTPDERNALLQDHNRIVQCRQIIITHDNQYDGRRRIGKNTFREGIKLLISWPAVNCL